jgi:hypothetical protein
LPVHNPDNPEPKRFEPRGGRGDRQQLYTSDLELFIHYGFSGGYRFANVEVQVELVGLRIISEKGRSFEDRFKNELIFGLKWIAGRIRPGLFYKLNLDKYMKEIIPWALGIGFDYIL